MRFGPTSAPAAGLVALLVLGLTSCGDDEAGPAAASAIAISCTATPASGVAPLRVAFSVQTNAGPALEISYGDGTTGTDPLSGHTYATPGAYRFSMTARSGSQTATCGGTVSVSPVPEGPPNQAPITRFHVFPKPPSGAAPLSVTFSGCESTDPDGDKIHFNYVFGDGQAATGACRRTHSYTKRGTFTAQVCASDGRPDHIGCGNFTVTVF